MATVSLLTPYSSLGRESKYSLNVNPLLKTRTQVHYQLIRNNKSLLIKRPDYQNNNFRVQCFMKSHKGLEEEKKEKEKTGKSLDEIIEEILKTLNLFIKKSAIAGVVLGLLMTYNPLLALAASGGCMGGGHSFSASSSSSSGSSSSSSWGSSDDDNSSRSSSSYSSPSYYSATVSSSSRPSYSSSWGNDSSPSYSSKTSSVSEDEPETAPGEKATVLQVLAVVIIWCGGIALIVELSDPDKGKHPTMSRQSSASVDTNKVTVMMLQVALLGATRSLQKDLDKIAEVADTSTTSGLSYILKESTVALLRHLAYCFSSYSSVDVKPDKTDGEKLFNQLTIEERAKFDEETLVNVDNIKKQSTPRKNPKGLSSDYIVMTILVAAKGENKLSVVNNSENLKEALQKLGSIPTSNILAVEVMWTPQEENDTLTERDLLKDYPRLRPL